MNNPIPDKPIQLTSTLEEFVKDLEMRRRFEPNKTVSYTASIKHKILMLKKSDTRFKDNQIYNQAIDDVLEVIK